MKNALLVARVIQLKWEPELWGSKRYILTNKRWNKSLAEYFIRPIIILIIDLFETLFTSREFSYDIYFFRELSLSNYALLDKLFFLLLKIFFFEKRFIRIIAICNLYYSELKLLLFSNFVFENACKEVV